jgi:protein-disulfide isomerase
LPSKKVPIGAPPSNAPSVGKANARVVVQVFEDLECPACGMFDPTLMKAVSRDEEVRLVFRHFPLRQHPNAKPAAMAVEEARRQKGNDAFWEMKRRIFATPQLSLEKLEGIAADMKLDAAAFAKAIRATALPAAVVRDLKDAERLKLEGTPAVIVNGQYLTELGEVADLLATFKAAAK